MMKREELPISKILTAWLEVVYWDHLTWEPFGFTEDYTEDDRRHARDCWEEAMGAFMDFIENFSEGLNCHWVTNDKPFTQAHCIIYVRNDWEKTLMDPDQDFEYLMDPAFNYPMTRFILSTFDPLNLTYIEGKDL